MATFGSKHDSPERNQRRSRPRILVLAGAYSPGFKAGGPIRSVSNLVAELGDEFDFRIITRDRDHTDTRPYKGVPLDEWIEVGKAKVFYARPSSLSFRRLSRVVAAADPQLVFLNSFFDALTIKFLALRRLGRVSLIPTLLAPRGEFDPGAFGIKRPKKAGYLRFATATGFLSEVEWQASSDTEATNIESTLNRIEAHVVPNLPSRPPARPTAPAIKDAGSVVFAFVSRISRMKNLPFLVEVLADVKGAVALEVYGPKESDEWETVENLIGSLPDNIQVVYKGILRHEEVDRALEQAHFLVLPTLGENFGHAIYESLRIGRPVVLSDRTPWRGLESEKAGWELSLDDRSLWVDTLQTCVDMNEVSYLTFVQGAHAYAVRWFSENSPVAKQVAVFNALLGR